MKWFHAVPLALVFSALVCCQSDCLVGGREDPGLVLTDADWPPPYLEPSAYAGATACQSCHLEIYGAWKSSPHGNAMAQATAESVLAPFAGSPVPVQDGTITPLKEGGQFYMRLASSQGEEKVSVDLVLGSGHQQQVYFSQYEDGRYRMLPIYWGTVTNTWIPTEFYQPAALDKRSTNHWHRSDLQTMECALCHLSQGHDRGRQTAWVDLPVNCESCHGPRGLHVRAMQGAQQSDAKPKSMRTDLKGMSQTDDARLCGSCHAKKINLRFGEDNVDGYPRFLAATLMEPGFRSDGTQLFTHYQLAAHWVSECYAKGSMTCSHCHDPHHQRARGLTGDDAEGPNSNRQCTVCHRNYIDSQKALEHTKHDASVQCVDCHMSFSWMFDNPKAGQATSDHSIQIPRPQETLDTQNPNGCNVCHKNETPQWALAALKKWGQTHALASRPWVIAIDAVKKKRQGAADLLFKALTLHAQWPAFVNVSLLDAATYIAPAHRFVAVVESFANHEDPQTRGLAVAALLHHDVLQQKKWLRAGFNDPHFYVRHQVMQLLSPARAAQMFSEAEVVKYLNQLEAYTERNIIVERPPASQ